MIKNIRALLWATVALVGSGTTPAFSGDDRPADRGRHDCSDRDLRGSYAYALSGSDLRSGTTTAFSASGVFRADGEGRITAWRDAFSVHGPGDTHKTLVSEIDFVAAAAAAGSEITYSVSADCRIDILFTALTPVGPVDFHLIGGVASRGREVLLQTGAPYIIGTGVARRTR